MHMIYKYTHWECMLNVFIHGGVGGQKSLRSIVIAHRDRVGVRKPRGF